ncbi:MAG: glycosyl transferase, group 1 family protein [Bacteroidetes bacterium]|nr:glycosyl transferase, group 1 family protein [Bacteroidota bacterium]
MSNKVIFIGGIGKKKEFGGELTKNKYIITRLEELGKTVISVDTYQSRRKPWKLWKLPFVLLVYPKSTLILSSSLGNIYYIIKFLYYVRLKKNVIYWGIGGIFAERIKNGDFNKKYFNYLKAIFVEGDIMKDALFEIGIKNVVTMHNFKKIEYIPEKKYGSNEIIKFVFLSRILPVKGVDYIIEATKILNADGYSNKFIVDFYGRIEPSYKENFLNNVSSISNINYSGTLDLSINKDIDKLASYDIMLFPTYSKSEGFPGVVISAYISGLPIIASDWNLNKEFIIDKETGIIIPTHSIEILYKSMVDLIQNPEQIINMSKICQSKVREFDLNTIITDEFISSFKI